ncbi:MAG TPA: START domain-containing protein, partial [bacterium]|nr:START domain-containing protein [bacterium]
MKKPLLALFLPAFLTAMGVWADTSAPTSVVDPLLVVHKDSEYHWQKSCETDGLTIYWSRVQGSEVIAFKGNGIVDEPLDKVASVIVDTTRGTEWIDSLVSSKVVRNLNPTEFVEYDHVGIPFPFDTVMSDRDFVSHVTVDYDPDTRRLTVSYLPAEDELAPVLKKYTRGVMTCVFRMVPMSLPDQTYVDAEVHCDPRGGVPKWLVNFFQE